MSWVRHVRDHCDAPADVKALLLVLATYADTDGLCWPSLERLAGNLSIHPSSAKRRRNRAVELGWLVIDKPGRWKGASTHYRLMREGSVGAPLILAQRRAPVSSKGVRGRRSKGSVGAPRTPKKFQEGDLRAPSLDAARLSQIEQRRQLAKAIREAKSDLHRDRFRATFLKEYGHLYGEVNAA